MNKVTKNILKLKAEYSKKELSLKKEYNESLVEIQDTCGHTRLQDWHYEIDSKGKLASDIDNNFYLYQTCEDCGFYTRKLDNNNYDSEIELL